MSTLGLLALIMKHLPEILALVGEIVKLSNEAEQERKVKDDLKAVTQAFKDRDAKALHDLFNR